MEDDRDWGPKPFRFINAWTLHPQFLSVIKAAWLGTVVTGWAGYVILVKLRTLRWTLKKWNIEEFGNVSHSVKLAENELHNLDLMAESRELSEIEAGRRCELRKLVWSLYKKQEWIWLQKSRLDWSMKGDKNTRFFHIVASSRQNRNLLNSISVGDEVVEDPQEVKQKVLAHFKEVFSEQWRIRPKILGQFQSICNDCIAESLEASFTEEEVWAAVKSCDGNKALGPDGFNLMCFQKCWKVFKADVLQFFNDFYENGKLVRGVNSSFITLIPKIDGPATILDYRPISLIGSLYKILAKVLTNRLRKVMPRVIGEAQSAFLEGRNILDGVLIANEVVDWWKKSGQMGLILKLDFEKTYDSVNWDCLLDMMSRFGFGIKWRKWI